MTIAELAIEMNERCRDLQIGESKSFKVDPPIAKPVYLELYIDREFSFEVKGSVITLTRRPPRTEVDYKILED